MSIQGRVAAVEDALHRLDGDLPALSDRALAATGAPRVRILRAAVARPYGLPLDDVADLAALDGVHLDPVDASLLAGVRALVHHGPRAASPELVRHGRDHPDDLAGGVVRTLALTTTGVPGDRELAHALVERDAARHPGDWRAAAPLAMVRQEQRRYDEARALATAVLAEEPGNGHGAHVVAHCDYETGAHDAGLAWLDGWRAGRRVALYGEHLAWHGALHALARGDTADALRRYVTGVGPARVADAGPLLWRCRLHEDAADADVARLAAEAAAAAREVLDRAPHFPLLGACFALAAAGDADTLRVLAVALAADARPARADLLAPVARALAALAAQEPGAAVAELDAVLPGLARVGGSNAQREVVEDTLLHALLADGRAERARTLLLARLERRDHVPDRRLLARCRAATADADTVRCRHPV